MRVYNDSEIPKYFRFNGLLILKLFSESRVIYLWRIIKNREHFANITPKCPCAKNISGRRLISELVFKAKFVKNILYITSFNTKNGKASLFQI